MALTTYQRSRLAHPTARLAPIRYLRPAEVRLDLAHGDDGAVYLDLKRGRAAWRNVVFLTRKEARHFARAILSATREG